MFFNIESKYQTMSGKTINTFPPLVTAVWGSWSLISWKAKHLQLCCVISLGISVICFRLWDSVKAFRLY